MKLIAQTLSDFNVWSVLFRLVLATAVGGLIGSERGKHGRAAGFRTHILVCLGATMTALVGLYATQVLQLSGDPMRVNAQVISGIGFLGAGTIITTNHSKVTGLTTAAGLWATAAIGLAIGIGFYSAVAVAFVVVLVTNSFFTRLEYAARTRTSRTFCYVELDDINCVNEFSDRIVHYISELTVVTAQSGAPGNVGMKFNIVCSPEELEDRLHKLRAMDHVVLALLVTQ